MDESESLAKAMGFVHDATKIDADQVPQYKAGSTCGNCMQLRDAEGDEWRPCNLFPGKLVNRSEEHTSELQSLMRISYAVFCLKKKKHDKKENNTKNHHK